MEVKINKEVRDFTESIFFGLSLRQCVFSVIACGAAVALYFLTIPFLSLETVSWLCIAGAAPFGALGFIRYHGMTSEQFAFAWFKSEVLIPRRLCFEPINLYYEAVKDLHGHNKRKKYTWKRGNNR